MAVNCKNSCCIRVGPRSSAACSSIVTAEGLALPWTDEVRYLGIHLVRSQQFKCPLAHTKNDFFNACNAIYSKIGRFASEDVILTLFMSKCLLILLYGLEAFALTAIARFYRKQFFMKPFKTWSIAIVTEFKQMFNCKLPSMLLPERALSSESTTIRHHPQQLSKNVNRCSTEIYLACFYPNEPLA